MRIAVNMNGVEATVFVDTADEAAQLLASIARLSSNSIGQDANHSAERVHSSGQFTQDARHGRKAATENEVKSVLSSLNGSAAAKVLQFIAKHPDGCADDLIKGELGDETLNLGPIFSIITKACVRFGLERGDVLLRRKEGSGKNITYHYKVTPVAKRAIESISGFGESVTDHEAFS